MFFKNEEDIMKNWRHNNTPEVSIKCMTYNQREYIEETIISFLSQETDFPFEIVIHDDASTDGTDLIVRKYADKYPHIINAIFEDVNLYSNNGELLYEKVNAKLRGKYTAYCEGDDYWIDPYKLQKQFNAMENDPSVDICAHSVKKIDSQTGKVCGYLSPRRNNCIIPIEEVITGGGGFVGTNSLFIRTSLFLNEPDFRKMLCLDYTLQVNGSLRGGMLYMADCMSVYRVRAKNSWSSRLDLKYVIEYRKKWKRMIEQLDIDTKYTYHDTISAYNTRDEIDTCLLLGDTDLLHEDKYRNYYKKLKGKDKVIYYIKAHYPELFLKFKKHRTNGCGIE